MRNIFAVLLAAFVAMPGVARDKREQLIPRLTPLEEAVCLLVAFGTTDEGVIMTEQEKEVFFWCVEALTQPQEDKED